MDISENTAPQQATPPVLLVDDEAALLRSASLLLRSNGIEPVETINDARSVLPLLADTPVSAIILDLNMPYLSGTELLAQLAAEYPHVPVVVMTAANDVETAVQCMQLGACDYLVKPVDKDRIIATVKRAMEIGRLRGELESLRKSILNPELRNPDAFDAIVTNSESMYGIFRYIEAIAPGTQPVLITGETGAGKELFARAIHQSSARTGRFVPVTVSGLDVNVFSDTLFGHKRGAFTGADKMRDGLVHSASNGTLFLDEIGDLCPQSQVKLLRFLQEREYYPLGADTPSIATARVVLATNIDLERAVEQGDFRKDLYYRLCGHHFDVLPLRERPEDIGLLINHFLLLAAQDLSKLKPTVPPEIYTTLLAYHFPGNVRELQAMIQDAVARHQGGVLSLASIREATGQTGHAEQSGHASAPAEQDLEQLFSERLPTLKEAEQFLIHAALKKADGNQSTAAGLLGLSRQALNKRLVRSRNH